MDYDYNDSFDLDSPADFSDDPIIIDFPSPDPLPLPDTSDPAPESILDTKTGAYHGPPRTASLQCPFDPQLLVPPQQIIPTSLNIDEAKSFAHSHRFKGFIVAPAKILSHVRSDKRRDLGDIQIQYYF